MIRRSVGLAAALVFALGVNTIAQAQTRNWDDNGDDASKEWSVANNWDPDGTPQPNEAIIIGFGIPTAFNDTTIVDQDFTISSLTLRGGADVDTNGNSLFVSSGAGVDLAGSVSLLVDPGGGLFTEHILVSQAAILEVKGAAGTTDGGLVRTADLQTTSSGRAGGHGTIDLIDSGSGPAMSNGGVLFVGSRPGDIPAERLPGTLSITGTGTLDLDGGLEDGLVDVDAMGTADGSISLTLTIEVPLADAFSGKMDIGNDDTVNIVHPWEMNSGGSLPAVLNFNGSISHTLRGGALTVNGATTQLNLNNGFTVFENDLTFNDGQFTLANGAGVRFNGTTTFTDANDFNLDVNNRIIVESVVNIGGATVAAGEDFDWDGPSGDAETEVRSAGNLNINVENVSNFGDTFFSNILMDSGNIDVQVADGVWTMAGRLNINNSANDVPMLSGDTVQIGDDGIIAIVSVGGTGVSRISAPTLFMSDASVNVAASAILETTGPVTFQSVNGASNADFFGAGTWRLAGTNIVSEATTINMTGGSVDLDNSSITATVANDTFVNAPLTINAANLLSYGTLKNNGGSLSSSDLFVDHTGARTGALTVNLDSPGGIWTVNNEGTLRLVNDNTEATLLAGSLVFLNGVLIVTGDVRSDARVHIEGSVTISTAGEPFRLSGGNLTDQPNTIVSGTIHGPGILGADAGTLLRGNGVINANIDFDGTAELLADGGTLTVNGAILDANIVGTLDNDGILNITNPWNMSGTVGLVRLQGGELRGGAVTTAGFGILGSGLVSAPVINNTALSASSATGGTLLVQTAANNNDWDGTTGAGQLNALSGNLEIRDNAQFPFTGIVSVGGGHTFFANGFELRFNSGSTLDLDGGTYRTTQTTFISGTVTVGAGGGRLQNDPALGFVFVNGSDTDLTGDLRLESSTTVNVGAEFKGAGSLVNRALLRLVDNAIVGVRVENQADLEIGDTNTGNIGQVVVEDFEQTADGELVAHLGGTAAGAFDVLESNGMAELDGMLRLALAGGYVPVLGQGFEILSADLGITGTFASVVQPTGMPAGLMFEAQYAAKQVNLKVVADAGLPGDYNHDGAVNAADYVVWRKTDGSQLGYNTWRANFGRTAGSSSSQTTMVPEPTGVLLACANALLAFKWRRRVLKPQRLA